MKKLSLTIGMIVLALGVVFSQAKPYVFKVLAAKGVNQIFTKGTWVSVNAGSSLVSGEKVKVGDGGYIGLIHSSGKTMELKAAGIFNVSDLESKVIQSKSTFGEKYGDFVADGMFASNPNATSKFNQTGSVTRGDNAAIFIYAPKYIKALKSEPLTLHWNACGGNQTFTVTLSDFFGTKIHSFKTTTNAATIDFNKITFNFDNEMDANTQHSFLLKIESNVDPSYTTSSTTEEQSYTVELLNENKEKEITASITQLKSGLDKTSAMDYLVLAMAYEKQGLMTYAVDSYSKAKALAPNVDEFSIQYENYIKTKLGAKSLNGIKGN